MIKLENVVLANIHRQYKLNEWREFCRRIESLPYSELMVNIYGRLVPKKDITNNSNYDNTILNGEN